MNANLNLPDHSFDTAEQHVLSDKGMVLCDDIRNSLEFQVPPGILEAIRESGDVTSPYTWSAITPGVRMTGKGGCMYVCLSCIGVSLTLANACTY